MTALVAYGLVGLLGLLGIVRHPGWALCGYYLVAFLRPMELTWNLHGARLSMPFVAAAVVGAVVHLVRHGWPRARSVPLRILALMLLHFWLAGHLLESDLRRLLGVEHPIDGALHATKLAQYAKMGLVLAIGGLVLNEPRWIDRLLRVMAFSAAFLGVWANYHYFVLHTYPITGPGPAIGLYGGIFADRNDFALFLAMGLVLCWYQAALTDRRWLKAAWLGALPFLLHGILLTESRGGLLAAGAAFVYITWRSPRRLLMASASGVGLAVALLAFTSESLLERYGTIGDYQEDASALSRLYTWKVGARMMTSSPLVGIGLENFVPVFYEYSDWQPRWTVDEEGNPTIVRDFDYYVHEAHQAHNMWIQRGAEAGVVGLLLLVAFVISIPWLTFGARRRLERLRVTGRIAAADLRRLRALAFSVEGALVPYLVAAFFLSMEDFEGLYVLGMLAGCVATCARRPEAGAEAAEPAGEPAGAPDDGASVPWPPPPRPLPSARPNAPPLAVDFDFFLSATDFPALGRERPLGDPARRRAAGGLTGEPTDPDPVPAPLRQRAPSLPAEPTDPDPVPAPLRQRAPSLPAEPTDPEPKPARPAPRPLLIRAASAPVDPTRPFERRDRRTPKTRTRGEPAPRPAAGDSPARLDPDLPAGWPGAAEATDPTIRLGPDLFGDPPPADDEATRPYLGPGEPGPRNETLPFVEDTDGLSPPAPTPAHPAGPPVPPAPEAAPSGAHASEDPDLGPPVPTAPYAEDPPAPAPLTARPTLPFGTIRPTLPLVEAVPPRRRAERPTDGDTALTVPAVTDEIGPTLLDVPAIDPDDE